MNWIKIQLDWIEIQRIKNGMQIGWEGIENLLMNMVLKFF
jgi:hypothetical protein